MAGVGVRSTFSPLGCSPWWGSHAPADGPVPMHTLTALSKVSGGKSESRGMEEVGGGGQSELFKFHHNASMKFSNIKLKIKTEINEAHAHSRMQLTVHKIVSILLSTKQVVFPSLPPILHLVMEINFWSMEFEPSVTWHFLPGERLCAHLPSRWSSARTTNILNQQIICPMHRIHLKKINTDLRCCRKKCNNQGNY